MDIRTELNDIRKKMGMCPQYNVLFNMCVQFVSTKPYSINGLLNCPNVQ